jgi:glycosyltransferase involved in cell wall biosynthesis
MNTLWILDEPGSALSISAHLNACKGDEFLFACDFPSLGFLVKAISRNHSDVIIFAWREPFFGIFLSKNMIRLFSRIDVNRKILLIIPDFLGVLEDDSVFESNYAPYISGLLFTSEELLLIYKSRLKSDIPCFRYFDRIEDTARDSLLEIKKEPGLVIWVGNSQWGSRRGHTDHKGFDEVIKPLISYCSLNNCGHKYLVIDSAVKYLPNNEVLQKIRQAEILLMPSKSEGTGMPFLEALSLGTLPLVSSTGVAPEILAHRFPFLLVKRDYLSYISTLHNLDIRGDVSEDILIDLYENYKKNVFDLHQITGKLQERVIPEFTRVSFFGSFRFSSKFYYRYLKNFPK